MKQITLLSFIAINLLLSGCTDPNVPQYSGAGYERIKSYEIGTVEDARPVVISDDGMGTFLGALVGTVVGSTMGGGRGSALTTLAGGLGGAYVGSQVAKANATELSVVLDSGRRIVVVVKGKHFQRGDRVKIITDGNRALQVYKL